MCRAINFETSRGKTVAPEGSAEHLWSSLTFLPSRLVGFVMHVADLEWNVFINCIYEWQRCLLPMLDLITSFCSFAIFACCVCTLSSADVSSFSPLSQ